MDNLLTPERALKTIPLGSQTFSKSMVQYPFGVSPYFINHTGTAFYINKNEVSENTIEQELKLLLNKEQEPAIILHADKTVAIEHVVKIMDIAYRNKYKIVLATTSK